MLFSLQSNTGCSFDKTHYNVTRRCTNKTSLYCNYRLSTWDCLIPMAAKKYHFSNIIFWQYKCLFSVIGCYTKVNATDLPPSWHYWSKFNSTPPAQNRCKFASVVKSLIGRLEILEDDQTTRNICLKADHISLFYEDLINHRRAVFR